ncbi:putative cytochrome oxidase, subunit I [Burkholderia pseudomallei MSHR1029]|nr:putative cytochrome oxidase, subunit I [Burkholderia pseudomallei MSHR1029]
MTMCTDDAHGAGAASAMPIGADGCAHGGKVCASARASHFRTGRQVRRAPHLRPLRAEWNRSASPPTADARPRESAAGAVLLLPTLHECDLVALRGDDPRAA